MGDTTPTHCGAVWSREREGWEGPSREEEERKLGSTHLEKKAGKRQRGKKKKKKKFFLFPFEILRIVVVMLEV